MRAKLEEVSRQVESTEAWRESVEERYNLCVLFYCLCKLDAASDNPKGYAAFNKIWLEENFAALCHLPKYTIIRSLPKELLRRNIDFQPWHYQGKVFSLNNNIVEARLAFNNELIQRFLAPDVSSFTKCLTLDEDTGKLCSASIDGSIKIRSCSDYRLLKKFANDADDNYGETAYEAHRGSVYCLTYSDGKLYSGSVDRTIKVWDCTNYVLITTLGTSRGANNGDNRGQGHRGSVLCLTIDNSILYSGSSDKTIKVWNCRTYHLLATLRGHHGQIMNLVVYNNRNGIRELYSSGLDTTVRVWDVRDIENNNGDDNNGNGGGGGGHPLLMATLEYPQPATLSYIAIYGNKLYAKVGQGVIQVRHI